jgi:sugar phosphate isomerase/epimerase
LPLCVDFYKNNKKRLQPGLSTYSFPWAIGVNGYEPSTPFSANDLLHFAFANKIRYVQFGDNLPLHSFSWQALRNLKETATSLHINIEVGTKRLTAENILNYLSIAQTLDSSFLRVVIDDVDFHPREKQVIEIIRSLIPHLKETGICLAIENHDRFPVATLRRIIEQTDPGSVGICLDTANSLGANEGLNEVIEALGQYTVNLHIKDITIKRLPHKMGFIVEGCAAGNGILNIPAIIQQLKPYNTCRTVTLEVWSQPEATIEQSIAKEKQWVETSIQYLKNVLT